MVATASHSVTIALWKETAFPLWRAIDKCWKRNVVSLVSSVMAVVRLPISCYYYAVFNAPCVGRLDDEIAGYVYVTKILATPLRYFLCRILGESGPRGSRERPHWTKAHIHVWEICSRLSFIAVSLCVYIWHPQLSYSQLQPLQSPSENLRH